LIYSNFGIYLIGVEFEMSLAAGGSPEIAVGVVGTLEYVAVKGKPKYFGRFIPETMSDG